MKDLVNLTPEKLEFLGAAIEGKPAGSWEVMIIKGELLIQIATTALTKEKKPTLKEIKQ